MAAKVDANPYGALDETLKCFMFVPETEVFEFCFRDIEGIANHQLHMLGGAPLTVSHSACIVGFLRQSGNASGLPHYPFSFAAPAIVTFSKSDMKHIAIDCDSSRDSAQWPQVEQVQSCPCCRKKTVEDGKTEHVLCMQPCTMVGRKLGYIGNKLLWRAFCVPCFARIGGQYQGMSVIDMVRGGAGDGIRSPARAVLAAFDRTSKVIQSGLSASIAADFMKWMGGAMGIKSEGVVERSDDRSDSLSFTVRNKVFETCAKCGKSSFQVMEEAGQLCEERTRPLMLCGGCKQRRYCSEQCQKADWKAVHKRECRELQALTFK